MLKKIINRFLVLLLWTPKEHAAMEPKAFSIFTIKFGDHSIVQLPFGWKMITES